MPATASNQFIYIQIVVSLFLINLNLSSSLLALEAPNCCMISFLFVWFWTRFFTQSPVNLNYTPVAFPASTLTSIRFVNCNFIFHLFLLILKRNQFFLCTEFGVQTWYNNFEIASIDAQLFWLVKISTGHAETPLGVDTIVETLGSTINEQRVCEWIEPNIASGFDPAKDEKYAFNDIGLTNNQWKFAEVKRYHHPQQI